MNTDVSNDRLSARAVELAGAVRSLQDELGLTAELGMRTTASEVLLQRTRRWILVTIVGLALDLSLTILGAGLFFRVNDTTDTLRHIQEVTSTQALCPLYGVFLGGEPPEDQTPEEREAYDTAIAIIQSGADALGC